MDDFQLDFPANHRTEKVLGEVLNDTRLDTETGKASVLVLLDLSATFDTADYNTLLHRLEHWVGFSGTVI